MSVLAAIALQALATGPAETEIRPANPANIEENFKTLMMFYPERARSAGEEGLVGFTIKLDRDAHPTACEVTFSSGHRALDQETCDLVLRHAVFQPTYDKQGNRVRTAREGVINWKLPSTPRSAVPAIPTPVVAADPTNKVICKRRRRSNNLAAYERVCMTAHEWELDRQQVKEGLEAAQGMRGFSIPINPGGYTGQ